MQQSKRITVSPNPVEEGEEITIECRRSSEVILTYKDSFRIVKLDKNGRATIKAPGKGGEEFDVSDGKLPRANHVTVKVISGSSKR